MNIKQIAANEVVVGDLVLNIGIVEAVESRGRFVMLTIHGDPFCFVDLAPVFVLDKTP